MREDPKRPRRAFTLIEVMIALAIIVVIGVFLVINLYGKRTSNDYKGTAQEIAALLQEAQSRAVSQSGGTSWGVYFGNPAGAAPFYALFSGASYSASTTVGRYALPADICYNNIASGSSTTVVFNPLSGTLTTSLPISIAIQPITESGCNKVGLNVGPFVGGWSESTSVIVGTSLVASVFAASTEDFYALEGEGTAVVYYAPINGDGTLGSWLTTSALPTILVYAPVAIGSGHIYVPGGCADDGGCDSMSHFVSTVYYAPINGDGTIGSWLTTTPLPFAIASGISVVNNGYLYLLGGSTSASSSLNTVYYAPINGDGTIGSWLATSPLPDGVSRAFVNNGYLYAALPEGPIYYAPINANGTIGSWLTTNAMPSSNVEGNVGESGGYVYVFGGLSGFPFGTSYAVSYAPINANGTIGSWLTTNSLPEGASGILVYNGYLYGEEDIPPPSEIAIYSAPFGGAQSVISINPTGLISVN